MGNIISESINQEILENKNSPYGDSFRLIKDREKEKLDETTSHDNITDPGINTNPQPFTYRDEQDITQEISPIRKPIVNPAVQNPLPLKSFTNILYLPVMREYISILPYHQIKKITFNTINNRLYISLKHKYLF